MKSRYLGIAAVAVLLIGGVGAAMAQSDTCTSDHVTKAAGKQHSELSAQGKLAMQTGVQSNAVTMPPAKTYVIRASYATLGAAPLLAVYNGNDRSLFRWVPPRPAVDVGYYDDGDRTYIDQRSGPFNPI